MSVVPLTKAGALRHSFKILINNDGKAGLSLPSVLHNKGAYQLLYHNLSRQTFSVEEEEGYYDALIEFFVCESSSKELRKIFDLITCFLRTTSSEGIERFRFREGGVIWKYSVCNVPIYSKTKRRYYFVIILPSNIA